SRRPLRGRREPRPDAPEGTPAARRRGAPRDPAHPALLGRVRGLELDRPRRRDAEDRLKDGAAGLRPGLPHAGRHRRRVGVRALALTTALVVVAALLLASGGADAQTRPTIAVVLSNTPMADLASPQPRDRYA